MHRNQPATATIPAADRPGSTARRAATLAAAAAALAVTAGCGGDPEAYNDADVTYATDVTAHHAQTLQLLDLSLGRQTLDPELGELADETRKRLFAEVDVTQTWLKTNDQPVPETALQHTHDDQQTYDTSVAGMLSADELHQLETTNDRNFQAAWLDALIAHEKGAIELAQTAVDDAQNADLLESAEADLARHEELLATLEDLAGA